MNGRILITGSSGLIGTSLVSALSMAGVAVGEFDLRACGENFFGDVRDRSRVRKAVSLWS